MRFLLQLRREPFTIAPKAAGIFWRLDLPYGHTLENGGLVKLLELTL